MGYTLHFNVGESPLTTFGKGYPPSKPCLKGDWMNPLSTRFKRDQSDFYTAMRDRWWKQLSKLFKKKEKPSVLFFAIVLRWDFSIHAVTTIIHKLQLASWFVNYTMVVSLAPLPSPLTSWKQLMRWELFKMDLWDFRLGVSAIQLPCKVIQIFFQINMYRALFQMMSQEQDSISPSCLCLWFTQLVSTFICI